MHDFQREDLTFLTELDASANWSEMGAMKTTTAEWLWAQKTKQIPNPRVLVVTTKSGKGTYFESLPEVLPDWDVYSVTTTRFSPVIGSHVLPIDVKLPNPLYMRPVCVVAHYHCFTDRACLPRQVKGENGLPVFDEEAGTFQMHWPKCSTLLTSHWDMVVLDEAHRIKNQDAQWARNLKKLKAEYRHIMTGTGFVNNPAEIWSLLNFLYPDAYTSYWRFRQHYCEEDDWAGYKKVVGIFPGREDEFRELVRRVGVRRTMIECFPDIDKPIETEVKVDLNPTQRRMYEGIKADLSTMDMNGVPLHSPNVIAALNRLRQICVATPEVISEMYDPIKERRVVEVTLREPSSKLDAAMEIIEGLEWDDERKDQVVVFSAFRDPLELLKKRLSHKNIPYLHLNSNMNDSQRYDLWHNIWPRQEHQVFLCTLGVGSESINLSVANRAIFLDQSWSPVQNAQAIGRIYRPGQKGVAQLIYIRANNTVDQRVLASNQEKHGWFNQIFGEPEEQVETEEEQAGTDDDV